MTEDARTRAREGIVAMIAACTIWGLAPLLYRSLAHVPPADVLAHRVLWSLVFFLGVLALRGRLGALGRALADRRELPWLALGAATISVNWFFFIYPIQIGRATEASLGYFIFPLVSVLFGFAFFREGLAARQLLAVGLAASGVLVLTLGLGAAPWLSLLLATSFGFYGAIKKMVRAGGAISVTAEVILLQPLVVVWLVFFATAPWRADGTLALLMLSGPVTAVPLVLFSYAAQRIPLAGVGILQYMNPSIQIVLAVAVFAEPVGIWHAIAFPVIWLALAIYTQSALAAERRARTSASTPGTA